MVPKTKRIKREVAFEGTIVTMYQDYLETPDGRNVIYDYIEHRKGAAACVAVTKEGKLVLVRQYRNALDRETIEIPAGARDSVTEDTLVCAKRELEEETGYRCERIEPLLKLKSTVAFCNEFIDVYLARGLEKKTEQKLDEDEFIEVEEYELSEVLCKIYDGEIQDAKTVAGILAYARKYDQK